MNELLSQLQSGQFDLWWNQLLSVTGPALVQAVQSLVVAILSLVVARWLRGTVHRSLKRTKAEASVALLVGQGAFFAVLTLGLVWILGIYGLPPTAILATIGALSLAVSLALQDVLKNLVAGLYLLIEQPFRIGDKVTVRSFEGVIENVGIRITTLRMADGQHVMVPNSILFAEVLINHGPVPWGSEPPPQSANDPTTGTTGRS